MSLGQLALHVASIPGDLTRLAQLDQFDAANANLELAMPESKAIVMSALDKGLSEASEYLASLSPDAAGAPWRLTLRGAEVFSMPRAVMLRSLLLNHWYHHRGQFIGLSASARCPNPGDLRPQCGRESLSLTAELS